MRIIFVDDERGVLSLIERVMRPWRDRWDMIFVTSAGDALEAMRAAPADVIVTDLRMPGTGGAELLERVRDLYPRTQRIVLSGECRESGSALTPSHAHLVLEKPCDPRRIVEAIEGLYATRHLDGEGGVSSRPPAVT